MDAFLIALNAVVPFLIYISYGFIARETGLVSEDFMRTWSKVCFNLFFPFVMFNSFYKIDPEMEMDFRFLAFGAVFLLLLIIALCIIVPKFVTDTTREPVIIQAIYRSNAVLFAMPMTQNIFGDAAVPYCAMLLAVIIPVYNICSVIIFERCQGKTSSIPHLILQVLKNPMIIGAIVGCIFLLFGIKLPASVYQPVKAFADLATPVALLILGGTLHFSDISHNKKAISTVIVIKMIFIPAIVIALSLLFRFGTVERFVLFSAFATPVATASFPMSAAMGGDAELAGELVVISTVVSVFTLFLWIFGMSLAGLL